MSDQDKASLRPTAKVGGGAVAGAATTIVLWVLEAYAHVQLPVPVASAIGVLVALGVAYMIPDNRDW